MDIIGDEQSRLERIAVWLDATRAELLGLAVLLGGAVLATGLLWWSMAGPSPAPAEVTGIEAGLDPAAGPPPADGDTELGVDAPAAADPAEPDELTVHVTGAVLTPGLVVVSPGARVADALDAAGGTSDEAELHRLNLARPVDDGEQIHVPREGEELPPQATREDGDDDGPVDLNRADAATLERLPGIGPARAAAIIEHREAHGPFAQPGDLRAVSGIGEATFQRLAELVTTS